MKAAAQTPIAARVKAAARTPIAARARMKIRIANARGEKKRKFPKRKSLNFACRSCHAGQERHAFISFLLTFLMFFPGPSGKPGQNDENGERLVFVTPRKDIRLSIYENKYPPAERVVLHFRA